MAPPSSTSSSDLGHLARAIRATIVIVVVIEAALAFSPENVMIRTMRWMRAALALDPTPAVQIHGDSVAQGALLAGEIEKSLPQGTVVWNAALQGSGPEFTYFLLKRQIEGGHVPGAIVMAHSPHTFVTERTGVLVGGFLDWREVPEALATGHHFFEALYGVLCRLSFTLRHHEELGELLKGRRAAIATWNDPIPTEAWVRKVGGEAEARWAREGKGAPGPIHPVYRQRFEVDPGEREYLGRTLALAHSHSIPVYWVTLPEHAAIKAVRDSVRFAPFYYAFVDSLAKTGEVRVLQREFEVLPAEEFSDYTHLRLRAALAFSREIGEKLARERAAAGAK